MQLRVFAATIWLAQASQKRLVAISLIAHFTRMISRRRCLPPFRAGRHAGPNDEHLQLPHSRRSARPFRVDSRLCLYCHAYMMRRFRSPSSDLSALRLRCAGIEMRFLPPLQPKQTSCAGSFEPRHAHPCRSDDAALPAPGRPAKEDCQHLPACAATLRARVMITSAPLSHADAFPPISA